MKILITGGAGYIGSTISSALIDQGHEPIILDSLITGRREFVRGRIFYKGDIADKKILSTIINEHPEIKYVIHCAAFIVVPESESDPYRYYANNVSKSLELFNNLKELGVKKIIFSSSASVYGNAKKNKVTENSLLAPESPYARTKYMMEMILSDFCKAYGMKAMSLRYFNPIGADPKMRTGVHVKNPTHVVGKLTSVALGKEKIFNITGVDWKTRDGSGLRDYVHVWDLAQAHVRAVLNFDQAFKLSGEKNYLTINLGTGKGVTVKELVGAFENVFGKKIKKKETSARPGDVAGAYASCALAEKLLGWRSVFSIEKGIEDALKWGEDREKILKFK